MPAADDPALARVLLLTVFAEATLGARINPLMEARFGAPEADKQNWSVRTLQARTASALAWLADTLGERPYLAGEALTLADIANATALGMYRGDLQGEIPPRLEAWRERLARTPCLPAGPSARGGVDGAGVHFAPLR